MGWRKKLRERERGKKDGEEGGMIKLKEDDRRKE
jgi:hypothetical protein